MILDHVAAGIFSHTVGITATAYYVWLTMSSSIVFMCSLHKMHEMKAYSGDRKCMILRPPACPSVCFNSRTTGCILMKPGMNLMQSEDAQACT
jgi:hypothetical protein